MYYQYLILVKRDPKHTVSVEFSSKQIKIGEIEVKLQLWDTAGQEKFRSVTKSYYKGAVGVIIVYDITRADSFQHIPSWLADAKNAARKDCAICLVGNKCDLADQRVITYNEGAKFSQENSKIYFLRLGLIHLECSAYTGENIDTVFHLATKNILKKIEDGILVMNENPVIQNIIEIKESSNENQVDNRCGNC